MKLAEGIRKHGFRKWYERELLTSHAHLVLTFLCLIGLFAGFEALGNNRGWLDQAQNIVTIGLSVAIGLWSLRRYLYYLGHAEATANQADCPQCKAYGSFTLEAEDDKSDSVQVCCRKCKHRWIISA